MLRLLLIAALFFAANANEEPCDEECHCECICDVESECTEVCMGQNLDVVFIVDSSGSIGSDNFDALRDFVSDVIASLDIGPDSVHGGLIRFASSPSVEHVLDPNKPTLQNAADAMTYTSGGTNTDQAIDVMTNMLQNGRADAIPVGIVITDGGSSCPTCTVNSVTAAHTAMDDLVMIAVGVAGFNQGELEEIATGPGDTNVLTVGDFDALADVISTLAHLICQPE